MSRFARIHVFKDEVAASGKRRQASSRLQSNELWAVNTHLDLVLNSVTDHAILTLDTDGRVTSWNRGARRTQGYDQSDIVGVHFAIFYTKADQDADTPMRALRIAQDLGRHECEGWRVRKGGELFWAASVIHPVRGVGGDLLGYVTVIRDISQRLQLEKLREELSQSQKLDLVGQLTSGVAHDFNNLLTTIEAGHDLLAHVVTDDRAAQILDINREAVRGSKKLIDQLLAFSRRQTINPRPSNVHGLITGLDALLKRAAGERIRFRWNLAPGLPPVLVDQAQFQVVLMHLVVNARDAMPDGGWLTIFMDRQVFSETSFPPPYDIPPGEYIVLGVSDTGTGMPPDILARATEPFFTTKAAASGLGLGLSQSYGFARQAGGTLRIDSTPGKGTTIRILLPVCATLQAEAPSQRPRTILFVEDDTSIRTLVSEVLRIGGHRVIEADDGRSALALLQQDASIDYLFTDIVMPNDMTGVELMNAARVVRPGLPTLLASGYPREALRDLGKIPDDVMFIAKPYALSDLNAHLAG
jgi:PAS domain S-box-containing protein